MIIKCSDCGLEYSYGRNLCHTCNFNTIFFGAIFKGDRKEYKWNCATGNKYADLPSKSIKQDIPESIIEIYPEG
jgi:hypothetical protein